MIFDFQVVLLTRNLSQQKIFYINAIGLEIIFDNENTVGLGKNDRQFIILREDFSEKSNRIAEHKGPQLLLFKCQGDINDYADKIKKSGFKVRDRLELPDYNIHYLFIEDFDGNEICLDLPINLVS